MGKKVSNDRFSEGEAERREEALLKRLLATPPDHRTKAKSGAESQRARTSAEGGTP